MGPQIIRRSEVFKNKACVSILFDPSSNLNGSLESRAAGRHVRSPGRERLSQNRHLRSKVPSNSAEASVLQVNIAGKGLGVR